MTSMPSECFFLIPLPRLIPTWTTNDKWLAEIAFFFIVVKKKKQIMKMLLLLIDRIYKYTDERKYR